MTVPTELRNATLADVAQLLKRQADIKLDAVVPMTAMRSEDALIKVRGLSVMDDEVTLRPTAIFDGHLAEKLGIPIRYLRGLREERPDLYDANVNGWIRGDLDTVKPDTRSVLLRTFSDPEGGEGVARALLSDRFGGVADNLDALVAALAGVKESGVACEVVSCDLSETRMSVRFAAPAIQALAPELLRNYNPPVRNGWGNIDRIREVAAREGKAYVPGEEPIVFAGFELNNSETGGGSFGVAPVLLVEICGNKLKVNVTEAFRRVHLGARLDEGVVRWSIDTQRKSLELISAQARDAVAAYLEPDFLARSVADIEAKAGAPVSDAVATIELISKKLLFSEDEQRTILDHFVSGGQLTAGGVVNAITTAAQIVESTERAWQMENVALEALNLVPAV